MRADFTTTKGGGKVEEKTIEKESKELKKFWKRSKIKI